MLLQDPNVRIWLYSEPTDMRKQFDGLMVLAKNKMQGQVVEGHLFVFVNRKRTQMKALYYSRGGLCLWSKRLEKGCFQRVMSDSPGDLSSSLNWAQLQCFIEGIHWQKAPKSKRLGD